MVGCCVCETCGGWGPYEDMIRSAPEMDRFRALLLLVAVGGCTCNDDTLVLNFDDEPAQSGGSHVAPSGEKIYFDAPKQNAQSEATQQLPAKNEVAKPPEKKPLVDPHANMPVYAELPKPD